MPGDGAVMKLSANALADLTASLKRLSSAVDRAEVRSARFVVPPAYVLLLADGGKAPHQQCDQFGKLLEFLAAPALRHAGKAGHALRHIGLETDALLFAVVADVDAGGLLMVHDIADRAVHLGVEFLVVVGRAGLLPDQQVGQLFIARQAANVGGQNAVAGCRSVKSCSFLTTFTGPP